MSTTRPSAHNATSRLRGDMYLRAEQRYREEMAALSTATPPAPTAPPNSSALDTPDRRSPVAPATEVVVMAPVSVTGAVVAARPAVELTAPGVDDARAPEPPRPAAHGPAQPRPLTPAPAAAHTVPGTRVAAARPDGSGLRRQRTLVPAAALGAIALAATLGTALTLMPGDSPEATPAAAPATAPSPSSVVTQRVATAPAARPLAAAAAPADAARIGTAPAPAVSSRPPAPVVRAARTPVAAGSRTPVAARSVAATAGQIRITSTPPGARVTVDGIGWGQTPLTVSQLAFGDRRIRVTQDGYASQESVVRISGDNPTRTVSVTLRRR